MSKPAGKCVFCLGRGRRTKGHVWPDWLGQVLPMTATHHEQETGQFYTFMPDVKGPTYEKRIKQGPVRSRKPRNTCGRCNSGWMSAIEGLAKPSLLPLIKGEPGVLTVPEQFWVASLLCLISLRLPYLGIFRAVTIEDVDWLRYYREPSENWCVMLAHFAGEKADDHAARYFAIQLNHKSTDKVGPEYCNLQVATLVLGQFCAHVFYSPVMAFPGYEGIDLCQIWPPTGFDVDTTDLTPLDDHAVLWLHETIPRTMPHVIGNTHGSHPI